MFHIFAAGLLMMNSVSLSNLPDDWRVINDGVMGGVSSSRIEPLDDHLVFKGELSLDNNGGFASVRRLVDQKGEDLTAVQFDVRGDGRRYQFRMRTNRNFDGVAWVAEFESGTRWQTVQLPVTQFQPQFRGRKVRAAGDLGTSRIRQIGFLLADKREGAFRLEFRDVRFINGANGSEQ